MSNVYAINYYYMSHGARTTSRCCGTVNTRARAEYAGKLLKMLKSNDGYKLQINVVKQKRKVHRNYELERVLKPEEADLIKIDYLSKI